MLNTIIHTMIVFSVITDFADIDSIIRRIRGGTCYIGLSIYLLRMGFETLGAAQLSPRLKAVLNNELANGLPSERRCAMRFNLRRAPSDPHPAPAQTP
ncbi:hypothetical protein [Pseudomonas mandelii]|uniref:hypothetical protein n=1 Tax=Pseudomonas mandelii TaxID=75612 RepID=UPI00159552D1|nr:hypothetical protein [Pseudomonas mandelii]